MLLLSKADLGFVLVFAVPAAKESNCGQKQPPLARASFLSKCFFPCKLEVPPAFPSSWAVRAQSTQAASKSGK